MCGKACGSNRERVISTENSILKTQHLGGGVIAAEKVATLDKSSQALNTMDPNNTQK